MKKIIITALLALNVIAPSIGSQVYHVQATHQASSVANVTVWVNLDTGIYHYKGERWYGRTRHGKYMTEKDAIAAGYRATRNGQ
jgi:hypothetical protein